MLRLYFKSYPILLNIIKNITPQVERGYNKLITPAFIGECLEENFLDRNWTLLILFGSIQKISDWIESYQGKEGLLGLACHG